MRVAFLGTPEAAVPTLRGLVDAGHDVVVVITRPDRRRGRGSDLVASPVKRAALELGLPVGYSLRDIDVHAVELGVVVAYGAIIPSALLAELPMLNVHFSLLPRWRGAAPVHRAILAGDPETGVAIISLEATLDTGPVHLERRVLVGEKTVDELTQELAELGAKALLDVLATPELLENPSVQVGEATYAEKLTKETFHLTPTSSAELVLRTVRLGGAFFFIDGNRLSVVAAHATDADVAPGIVARVGGEVLLGASDGAVALVQVRPEGSKTMSAQAWWAGHHGKGDQLSWR
ncbi:MAG TPA: methionyl-tRNA formyltransferase [Acidimicrobiales bacterium]